MYTDIIYMSDFTNVLFIDSRVSEHDVFVNAVNSVTFPIVYTTDTSKTDVFNLLNSKFTNIKNIAVCSYTSSLFLDSDPFFNYDETTLSPNVSFMIDVIKQFNVENIHFLACDSLNDPSWVNYFNILKSNTTVVVGASDDKSGNIRYGGNWEMENISTNIEPIYFSSNIEAYKYLLDDSANTVFLINGKLYACGPPAQGQLPGLLGNTPVIRRMNIPAGKTARDYYLDGEHCGLVCTDGTYYFCGRSVGGVSGLNLGGTQWYTAFTLVPVPDNKAVRKVSFSNNVCVIICEDGTAYCCGTNSNGSLPKSGGPYLTFQQIALPLNKTAMDIAGGGDSVIMLMNDMTVYGCGSSTPYGTSVAVSDGTGTLFRSIPLSSFVPVPPAGVLPSKVFMGAQNFYSMILMSDGTIYGVGSNGTGCLGLGNTTNVSFYTKAVLPFTDKVTKIVMGAVNGANSATTILTEVGKVYSCGANFNGQLGINLNPATDTYNTTLFTEVVMDPVPTTTYPIDIQRSANNGAILMSNGVVYTTGTNNNGSLGSGSTTVPSSYQKFTRVSNVHAMVDSGKTFTEIYVSGGGSIANMITAGYTTTQLIDGGLQASAFRLDGYTALGAKNVGFTLVQLIEGGYTFAELKTPGGFTAANMKAANVLAVNLKTVYTVAELKTGGYTATDLKVGLFTATDLKASFTATELRDSGYSAAEALGGGYTLIQVFGGGYTIPDIRLYVPQPSDADLLAAGFSQRQIDAATAKLNNTDAATLKSGGYTATELRIGGFTVAELLTAQFTVSELITAQFTVHELKSGGATAAQLKTANYTVVQLISAGYTTSEIILGGYNIPEFKTAGYTTNASLLGVGFTQKQIDAATAKLANSTATSLKTLNYTADELRIGGYSSSEIRLGGYNIPQLKDAGFTTNAQLLAAGFTQIQIDAATAKLSGSDATTLKLGGANATTLKTAGFTAAELKLALFTAAELKTALFTLSELKIGGFTATELKEPLYLLSELKAAGFLASELKVARYTIPQLREVNFLVSEIAGAFTQKQIDAADAKLANSIAFDLRMLNYTADELRIGGYSSSEIRLGGYNIPQLKDAGFTTSTELLDAGFTQIQIDAATAKLSGSDAATLKSGGANATTLKAAGFTAAEFKVALFTATELKAALFTLSELKLGGFTATELKEPVYLLSELKEVGFIASELKVARYTIPQLIGVNFLVSEIAVAFTQKQIEAANAKLANSTAFDLRILNYTADELRIGGYTSTEIRLGGYNIPQLRVAGFITDAQLLDAGFTQIEIDAANAKSLGSDATTLKSGGANATTLKAAGFTADDLKTALFTATELKDALFTLSELKEGGFTATELKEPLYLLSELKTVGFLASELKVARYTIPQLRGVNFNESDIASAFTQKQIDAADAKITDATAFSLRVLGFTADELRIGGYTTTQIRLGGYNIPQLRDAGFTTDTNLLGAGFTQIQIDAANAKLNASSASTLKQGGANATTLKAAGFTAAELKVALFTAAELRIAEFTLAELKLGGFTAAQLKEDNYTSIQLKDAGFTSRQLKEGGYSATDMYEAGYTAGELKFLGYTYNDLTAAGFTELDLYILQTYYLDSFEINTTPIDSTFSGEDTTPLIGDATAIINVPHSVINEMFKFKPATDGTSNTQYKFVRPINWITNYDPANAIVVEGSMSETSEDTTSIGPNSTIVHTNSIKFDYVKYISQQLFYNWRLFTLFSNFNEVAENISNTTSGINENGELYKRFVFLNDLGTVGDTTSINNPSRAILQQILKNDLLRLENLEIDNNGWFNVPIKSGEYIAWNIIINPSLTQSSSNNRDAINPRKYLVKMHIIDG